MVVDTAIVAHWGGAATVVANAASSTGELRRTVRLYDTVDVVLIRAEPHKELTGGIVLGDVVEVSDFGTWFTADHPDLTGLHTVIRRLDGWVRLRLGMPDSSPSSFG